VESTSAAGQGFPLIPHYRERVFTFCDRIDQKKESGSSGLAAPPPDPPWLANGRASRSFDPGRDESGILTPKIKLAVALGWAIVQVAAALPHVFYPLRFLGHVIARSLSHRLAAARRSKTIACDFGNAM